MFSPYRLVGACLAPWLLAFLSASPVRAWDDVVWSAGGSDQSWSTPENWSSLAPPGAGDRVIFTDAGATTTIGETTSVLAEDWEIAALSIQNGVRVHHSIDLGGHSLSISDRLDVNDFTRGVTTTTIKNGRLTLGSSDRPAELSIGSGDESAWIDLDLTGIHFDAHLRHVAIGDVQSDLERIATLTGGVSGSFVVGSPSSPGTFVVGRSVGPEMEFSHSRLDLREQDTFATYVDELLVGVDANSFETAFVYGAKTSNLIQANAVRIGVNGQSYSGIGDLSLQGQSVIRTSVLEVGVNSSGYFSAGNLELGTSDSPVRVMVGNRSVHSLLGSISGNVWTGGTFNAYLQELVVGVQEDVTDTTFNVSGRFETGFNGHIQLGTSASPGSFIVGRNANATVSLNSHGSLSAHVDKFWVGTGNTLVSASSTLELPSTTEIFANSMRIGYHEYDGTLFGSSRATVKLNGSTKFLTDELFVGIDATGSIGSYSLQSVEFGAAAQPMRLILGHATGSSWADGSIDLSPTGRLDAFLTELVMGEALESSSSRVSAVFRGGSRGLVTLGSPDARGQLIVAKSAGAASAEAKFDLSGQDRFVAYLDRFEAGLGAQSWISSTIGLARDSLIDVPEMHIGKSSRDLFTPQASITLGRRNTIRTDRIVLGVGTINATIQGRADSELQLGEPNRRVDVAIASGELGATTRKFTSALDLSRTATTAWLGDVSVGNGHADNPLALTGRLAFGPNSHIEARSITLAQGNATGILELSGGELLVDRIARGAGPAQFKWTGGTLEVGEFGDDDFAFDLANLGQGILGIPDVSGLATIHGDYSQGPQATLEVHGRAAGVEQVSVRGSATLGGTLALRLEPGFHPVVGETFLLVAAAGVGGTFDRVTGFLAGDTFLHPLYSASSIELRAYRAGDGNLDGAVDGADYTRWSDHYLTTTHQGVAAGDYNGDGLVDGADYTLWADHFTATPSLTLATHAVPEPSSRLLALLGIVLGAAVSRGRAKF